MCVARCGLNVYLAEGKVVRVEGMAEHPINRGRLCPKAAAIIDYEYSPERLRYPLKRENGNWKRISWEEALDIIASRLTELKATYGAKSLVVFAGMQVLLDGLPDRGLLQRFCDVYGTPNYFNVDSMCFRPRVIAYYLTFGERVIVDVGNAKLIMLWGNNPDNSDPPTARRIRRAKGNGAKLIVIDPRRTFLAKEADIHVQPRPGTDCALALGMLNVIVSEGLYDKEFIAGWTVGFEKLAEHVESYVPEKVAEVTSISADRIREIARVYASVKPACIYQGTNALDQTTSGFQTSRAIAILQAVTGNVDVSGGFVAGWDPPIRPPRLTHMLEEKPLWWDEYPLAYEVWGRPIGEGQGMGLPDVILTGNPYPLKAMIVAGSNPVLTLPDSKKAMEALIKLDFLVVMDIVMTETAQLAHLVLPAATFLERTNIPAYGRVYPHPYVMLRKKVTEFEESWSDAKFWLALAKRMGFEQYFPWKDPEEFLDYSFEPSGLSVKMLTEEKPEGLIYEMKYGGMREGGLLTPSRKIEIYSETMDKLGYAPLPTYSEPVESPISTPEIAREYPLILTTGSRMLPFLHSRMRNIPRLRKRVPEPFAEIHPETAGEYGVKEGDIITVSTRRGDIDIKAKVTEDIMPQVINLPHGWAQANCNVLTFARPADPISGVPTLKALLCKIARSSD